MYAHICSIYVGCGETVEAEEKERMGSSKGIYHILAGESEIAEQCFLKNALTQLGHFVEIVATGDQARLKLRQGSFSILILDLNLPHANGMEILRELRAEGHRPGVIFTAIAPEPGDRKACEEFDRVEFLQKPYRVDELKTAIGRISAAVMC